MSRALYLPSDSTSIARNSFALGNFFPVKIKLNHVSVIPSLVASSACVIFFVPSDLSFVFFMAQSLTCGSISVKSDFNRPENCNKSNGLVF